MTLRDEILQKCPELAGSGMDYAMAEIVSQGRVASNNVEIGVGTVLDVMGIQDGSVFLDIVYSNSLFRYVKPLLEQGRLRIGLTTTQNAIKAMVPSGAISQAHADALCALGFSPAPVTPWEVAQALEGYTP